MGKRFDNLLNDLPLTVIVGFVVGMALIVVDVSVGGILPGTQKKEVSIQEFSQILEREACSPTARKFALRMIDDYKKDIDKGVFDGVPISGVEMAKSIMRKKVEKEGKDFCLSER